MPTFPLAVAESVAVPMVLVDPATGEPYAAGATTGGAQDSTLVAIEALLATPAAALPPTPLQTTSDLTVEAFFSLAAITASQLLIAGVTGKVIRVFRHDHECAAAQRVMFYDGDPAGAGTLIRGYSYGSASGGGAAFDNDGRRYFKTTAGNGLYMKLSTAAQTDGAVYGTQV